MALTSHDELLAKGYPPTDSLIEAKKSSAFSYFGLSIIKFCLTCLNENDLVTEALLLRETLFLYVICCKRALGVTMKTIKMFYRQTVRQPWCYKVLSEKRDILRYKAFRF